MTDTPPLVITDVRIVTGTGEVIERADVTLAAGRITRITQPAGARSAVTDRADPGAQRIDGRDCTLIPGLIDAHCHLDFLHCRSGLRAWWWSWTGLPRALTELVNHGITTIRTMAAPPRSAPSACGVALPGVRSRARACSRPDLRSPHRAAIPRSRSARTTRGWPGT